LIVPGPDVLDKPPEELSPTEVLMTRCVLYLDVKALARELLGYPRPVSSEDFEEGIAEWFGETPIHWVRPLEDLLAGADVARLKPRRLWQFTYGIGADGMMGGESGFGAEIFDHHWALVTDHGWCDVHGPLRIPLGLVPRRSVTRLAPQLVNASNSARGIDWGIGQDLPFDWFLGDPVALYRFWLAETGVTTETYTLTEEELLRRYPQHPEFGWGIEEVRSLVRWGEAWASPLGSRKPPT
jgi:hypothetical protein